MSDVNGVATIMLDAIKAAFKLSNERDTKLTNEQLADLVNDQSDADNMSADDWSQAILAIEEEEGNEDDSEAGDSVSLSATGRSELGVKLARKLNTSEWKAFFEEGIKAKEFGTTSAVRSLMLAQKTFSKEELDSLPEWNSKLKHEDGSAWTNNPDIYKVPTGQGKKTKTMHVIYDVFDLSDMGTAIQNEIDRWDAAERKLEDADPELKAKQVDELKDGLRFWKNKQTTSRNNFRNGIRIYQKMQLINETFDKFFVALNVHEEGEDKGKLKIGPSCILVQSKANAKVYNTVTYGNLLNANVQKIKDKGGDQAAFMASFGRGKKGEGELPKGSAKLPKTFDEAFGMLQMVLQYFDPESDDGRKNISGAIAKMGGKGGDIYVETFGDFEMMLDGNIHKVISRRYDDIKASKASQTKPEDTGKGTAVQLKKAS